MQYFCLCSSLVPNVDHKLYYARMRKDAGIADRAKRTIGIVALTLIYGATILLAGLFGGLRRLLGREPRRSSALILVGTFHNPNWFFAHITPLVGTGFERITVIADGHVGDVEGIEAIVPPSWMAKVFTRAGAKMLMLLSTCRRVRPSMVIGYHIIPSAIMALVAARYSGALAGFQVTSGPLELEGGGWHAENRLLISLGWPSMTIEKLAHAITRRFDLVVVRGSKAHKYVKEACRYSGEPAIVTGSVATSEQSANFGQRDIDILFVGRLAEYKRPDRFVCAMREIVIALPDVRAVVAGDGPDREEIETLIAENDLGKNIELLGLRNDVPKLMSRSRVLLQTSRWEGVSIAVLESMMHGVVPVVSDVGDLRDVISNDGTGYVVQPDDIAGYASRVISLLKNAEHWQALSTRSRQYALDSCSTTAISNSWRRVFSAVGATER
jgi:glycosyltransferase involved in cell wall biosynthesis